MILRETIHGRGIVVGWVSPEAAACGMFQEVIPEELGRGTVGGARREAGKGRQVIKLWAPEARSCWRPVGTAQVASERSCLGVRGPGAFGSSFPSVLA